MVVVFDAAVPTFRHEKFRDYKKNRPPAPDELKSQFPIIKKVVEAFGIRVMEVPGYEADDVIAYFARNLPEGWELFIVSSDKDIMQLVNDRIRVIAPVKGITEIKIFDEDEVREKYGVPPKSIPDLLALMGDSADNIPGVPGIGEKTARALLEKFSSVEEIYSNLEKVYPPSLQRKLMEGKDLALVSRDLAILKPAPIEVSFDELEVEGPDYRALAELFRDLEFRTLMEIIPPEYRDGVNASGIHVEDFEVENRVLPLEELVSMVKGDSFAFVFPASEMGTESEELYIGVVSPQSKKIFWDRRSLSRGEFYGLLKGFSGNGDDKKPAWIWDLKEVLHKLGGVFQSAEKELKVDSGRESVDLPLFSQVIHRHNTQPIGSEKSFAFALSELPESFRDLKLEEYLLEPGRSTYALLDASSRGSELIHAVWHLLRVNEAFKEKAYEEARTDEAPAPGTLAFVYERVEKPLVPVLYFMEKKGIKVDSDYLKKLSREFSEKVLDLSEKIYSLSGERFNINSPQQLQIVLFQRLGLPPVKKTKTGFSTDNEVLKALQNRHPVVPLILEYRTLMKLKSSYIDALPRQVNPKTGRIHARFHQCGTATGRLSSSDPNLQNIPARGEYGRLIRNAFVAGDGKVLISADYSQIELRVLAHLSGDEHLIEIFEKGEDVHSSTASKIFGVPPEKVTSDMRRVAKVVNFGIVYGMSPHGLATELGISHGEARDYIENYFKTFPGVKAWIEKTIQEASRTGFVRTLFGRIRSVPEIKSKNPAVRKNAERVVVNTPVQGTAADLMKMAMAKVFYGIPEADVLVQVHDELIIEVEEDLAEDVKKRVREAMESVYALVVPLVVEVSVARRWGDLK